METVAAKRLEGLGSALTPTVARFNPSFQIWREGGSENKVVYECYRKNAF
jgi:hypothetical protein